MFIERTEENEAKFQGKCHNLECGAEPTHYVHVTFRDSGWNVVGYACEVDVASEVARWRDHYRASDLEEWGVSACRLGTLPTDRHPQ